MLYILLKLGLLIVKSMQKMRWHFVMAAQMILDFFAEVQGSEHVTWTSFTLPKIIPDPLAVTSQSRPAGSANIVTL